MATMDSLAKEYAGYLQLNSDSIGAVSEVARRIESITHTSSGLALSQEDRLKLVSKISEVLRPTKVSPDGLSIAVEAEDSSEFMRMIEMLRAKLVSKKS